MKHLADELGRAQIRVAEGPYLVQARFQKGDALLLSPLQAIELGRDVVPILQLEETTSLELRIPANLAGHSYELYTTPQEDLVASGMFYRPTKTMQLVPGTYMLDVTHPDDEALTIRREVIVGKEATSFVVGP